MNVFLSAVLIAAAAAGPTNRMLEHIGPVPLETAAAAPLQRVVAVSGGVPGFGAVGRVSPVTGVLAALPLAAVHGQSAEIGVYRPVGGASAVGGVVAGLGGLPGTGGGAAVGFVPQFGALAGAAIGGGGVPGFKGLAGTTPVVWKAPVFAAQGSVAAEKADPLLAPIEVWEHGAVGELRRQAAEAAGRGDHEAFERLAAKYWDGLKSAEERRRAFGERGRGGEARKPGPDAGR